MKKQLFFLLATILGLSCFSQISFEKGYYINNSDQKIDCLIKNADKKNNPTEIEYKLSDNSEPKKATIESVKEFSIENVSKYVRKTVNIDRSSENPKNLGLDKNPKFHEEELFLKVLVEGKSNLYLYVDGNLKRYFYTKENSTVEQLVIKRYKTIDGNIAINNRFRQQLWSDLECPSFQMSKMENMDYTKNDLVRFFTEYSECHNVELINFKPKQKRDLLNLTIRPRVNSSSLSMQNSVNLFSISDDIDFGNRTGFGLGLEVELILPSNKNKWAIAIEPNFQNFKSEKTTDVSNVSGGTLVAKVDYSSLEVPFSLRHYFFLNKNSKVFLNAVYIFDLSSNSSIEFTRGDGSSLGSVKIETRHNAAIGMGYKQNDRYSLELRLQTSREILDLDSSWNSEYKTLSVVFGYSLF